MASLQESAEKALSKLPYSLASMKLPPIVEAPAGGDPKMRAGIEEGNGNSPIYVQDKENWTNPGYTPQLLGHEMYHDKINNLPPIMRKQLPPDNPNDPYNDNGRMAKLKKVGGDPLKLPNEEGAADIQDMIAAKQRGEKLDPIYDTFDQKVQALPESVMKPTDPNQKGINTMPRDPGLPQQPVWGMGKILQAQDLQSVKPTKDSAPDFIPATADSTPDFIPAEPSAPPQPVATMSAAKPQPWLNQVEEDLRQGGNRTLIGRGLGHLQGNGDKGYSGLESGVSPETASFMGSPELGLTHALQGESETLHGHPVSGGLKTAGGMLEAGTIPSAFMGGPAAEAAGDALPELIPTRSGAGKLFQSVMEAAKDEPVSFTRSMPHLERTQQLASSGAAPLRPADLLYSRVNTVNPVPYSEARDFASNLSRMSAADKMATNPQMAREAKLLSHSLNSDIGDAADNAGVGDDYRNAMSQYRRAARNTEMAKTAGKVGLKYAVPTGVGYEAIKHFTR